MKLQKPNQLVVLIRSPRIFPLQRKCLEVFAALLRNSIWFFTERQWLQF